MNRIIDLTDVEDLTAALEQVRRECRLNGFVVVDYDLDEHTERKYVVIKRKREIKVKAKARFF